VVINEPESSWRFYVSSDRQLLCPKWPNGPVVCCNEGVDSLSLRSLRSLFFTPSIILIGHWGTFSFSFPPPCFASRTRRRSRWRETTWARSWWKKDAAAAPLTLSTSPPPSLLVRSHAVFTSLHVLYLIWFDIPLFFPQWGHLKMLYCYYKIIIIITLKMRKVMFWSPCIYLFICLRVTRITQKVLNRIAWHLVGWLVIIRGPFH